MSLLLIALLLLAACGTQPEATEAPVEGEEQQEEVAMEEPEETVDEGTEEEVELPPAPETIRIGNPIALSGVNAAPAAITQVPSYDLWVEDVNADGGIYVAEYDAKIPVEIIRYDDTSDIGTSVQLMEQLILEDEVDFVFPPWGTAFNFAIAPLVSEHEMPVMGCTMSSLDLAAQADQFPYFFAILNQPDTQGAGMVEVLQEVGAESVAIIRHDDLHGIELESVVIPLLEDAGIEIVLNKSFPVNTEDVSQLLREVQSVDPGALLAFAYPPENFLITGTMQEIGYSPDLFLGSVGIAFPVYPQVGGGPEVIEGVMGTGAWSPNVEIEGAREYFDRHVAMFEAEPDRWASAACYATGQVLQQA
ncbi:MAG: amino acid ABC transporter substrate-binding protein, partial [Saprospiraceae bacterium]|nr:amino acid ABC transporter substrate-binding protein [Saprospiraceae bacterium]